MRTGANEATSSGRRVSVPGGSHQCEGRRARANQTQTKGGISTMAKKAKGGKKKAGKKR